MNILVFFFCCKNFFLLCFGMFFCTNFKLKQSVAEQNIKYDKNVAVWLLLYDT